MRRCMYCLLPLDANHVGLAHARCEEKQREIVKDPVAKRMVGMSLQRVDREEVIRTIEKNPNTPYKQIANRFGTSVSWISFVAREGGIRRGDEARGPKPTVDRIRIAEELAGGMPVKTIARTMGCSVQIVYRIREALAL